MSWWGWGRNRVTGQSAKLRSGSWLVLVMLTLGLLLTGAMYTYLRFRTAPFVPLMREIEAEFPDSHPRVEGGKPRLDRPGDRILRVVMEVSFDPVGDSAEDRDAGDQIAAAVGQMAREQMNLHAYEVVELHLFRRVSQRIEERIFRLPVQHLANSHPVDSHPVDPHFEEPPAANPAATGRDSTR